jgi:hypothetical protein
MYRVGSIGQFGVVPDVTITIGDKIIDNAFGSSAPTRPWADVNSSRADCLLFDDWLRDITIKYLNCSDVAQMSTAELVYFIAYVACEGGPPAD